MMPVPAGAPENPAGCDPTALPPSAFPRLPLLTSVDPTGDHRRLRPPPVRSSRECSGCDLQVPATAPVRRVAWDLGQHLPQPESGQAVPAQLLEARHLTRAGCHGYHRERLFSLGHTFLSLTNGTGFSLKP